METWQSLTSLQGRCLRFFSFSPSLLYFKKMAGCLGPKEKQNETTNKQTKLTKEEGMDSRSPEFRNHTVSPFMDRISRRLLSASLGVRGTGGETEIRFGPWRQWRKEGWRIAVDSAGFLAALSST